MKKLLVALATLVIVGFASWYFSTNSFRPLNETRASAVTIDKLLVSINVVREKNGLPAFTRVSELDESARLKCKDLVDYKYYGHKNPVTGKHGYSYVGETYGFSYWDLSENLNTGLFKNSQEIIDSWMSSKPHAESILNRKYTQIGFAVCNSTEKPGEIVIVQHKVQPM